MKAKPLIFIIVLLSLGLLVSLILYALVGTGAGSPDLSLGPAESGETLVSAAAAPTPLPTPEPTLPLGEPQYAAEQLSLTLDYDDPVAASNLLDAYYQSDYTLPAGTELTLTSGQEISSLYIIFGTYPGEWTLRSDGGEQPCGQDGFLHECVAVDTPSRSVQICLSEDEDVLIRDIYAFSEGYLPDYVQTWQHLEGGADILLFSSHADDELIFFGGLIPYYSAERGARVQVAYMTSNYLSDFSNYRFRPHEALNGLWECGDHFYPVTNDVPDYESRSYWDAVYYYGEEEFVAFQVEQIRRFKPLVVVTQAEDGEYGHGTHILTALSVEEAVEAAADPNRFPESAEKYGVWDTPKTYLHYYGDPDEYTWLSYEKISPALGWRTPFQAAQAAYRMHLTQQHWGFYVYGFGHPYDSHRFGLYRSLVGADEKHNDLLEHVSREDFPFE